MAEWAAAPGGAGRVGRRSQVTLRDAAIGVLADRRARHPRVVLAEQAAGVPPLSDAEVAAAVAAGEPHYEEPYSRQIDALASGGDVEVSRDLLIAACRAAGLPIPLSGHRFTLTSDNGVTDLRDA